MLKNYQNKTYEEIIEREIVFDDGYNNGFAFPCDEKGKLLKQCGDCAINNYDWCLEHPERFVRFNKIITTKRIGVNPAHGTCDCGEEIYLYGNGYYGAWDCPNCGKWYNYFGQEINPPDQWEENMEEY